MFLPERADLGASVADETGIDSIMYILLLILATALMVGLDQFTKHLAVQYLASGTRVPIWDGVLELYYSENRGIAWGMLQDLRWPVIVVTALMLAFVLYLLVSGRFRHSRLATIGGTMVLAGGIGNLIDRVAQGFVVDFIHYYKWFDFPIFNVADCFVSIGAVLILIYVFFFDVKDNNKDAAKEADADGTATANSDA